MRRWAALLIVLGVGSFVLPLLGVQFRVVSFVEDAYQPVVGLLMAAAGVVLLFGDKLRDRWLQRGAGQADAAAGARGAGLPAATGAMPRGEFCPECGQRVAVDASFCGHCGRAFGASPPSGAGAPAAPPAAVGSGPRQGGPLEDRPRLNRIAERYQGGEFAASREQLLAYLREYPQDPTAWSILSNAAEELGDRTQAENAARHAIAVDPNCVGAHNKLGKLNRERKDYAAATACYQRALAIDPGNAHAHSGLSVVELSQGHRARALELARRAYELDTQDPVVASNLAVAYHCNGQQVDRDRMKGVAVRLGYKNLAGLESIFRGEVSVEDRAVKVAPAKHR